MGARPLNVGILMFREEGATAESMEALYGDPSPHSGPQIGHFQGNPLPKRGHQLYPASAFDAQGYEGQCEITTSTQSCKITSPL
jgi:hypothetical protein